MKTRKDTVRRLYREAILKYFGANLTKDDDKYLNDALKRDVHIAGNAPGQWVGDHGVLEIYCEGGIPNATDIQDWRFLEQEFGVKPKEAFTYNSDKWFKIDQWVNLGLESIGKSDRVYHEPYNNAVIGIHWS